MAMTERRQDKSCDPCKTLHDKHSEDVRGFCVQCVEYLCKTCVEHHRKLKASRSHVILTGQDIPDNKTAFQLLEKLGKCPVHEDEELTYECKQHETFLCVVCAKDKHMGCGSLVEISLKLTKETYLEKVSKIQNKLQENEEEIWITIEDLDDKAANVKKQAKEIKDKQMSMRFKLENALKKLKHQEEMVETSCKNKLHMIDTNRKKLVAIDDNIQVSKQLAQVVADFGRPSQLYIVSNGQFDHSETDLQTVRKENESITGLKADDFDIEADISNLFFTVAASRVVCDTSSESVDDRPHNDDISPPQEEETQEGSSASAIIIPCKKVLLPLSGSNSKLESQLPMLMDRSIDSGAAQNVQWDGESKQCDIVGVATIDGSGLIVFADYANINLKVFDSNLTALNRKSLPARPCSLCVVKNGCVAVLLVEKMIVKVRVVRDEIKHLRTFNISSYGHSLTYYGSNLAVLCSGTDTKFNGDQILDDPIKVLVINPYNGDLVKEVDEFYLKPREEEKEVWFDNPRQIYSRSSSEFIISSNERIKVFFPDGVQRWYYERRRQLRGASGITSDNEGNLYVCGYDSNNVHQISRKGFFCSRVIIPELQHPWAITFDKEEEQLIVSSRQCNTITIYKFKSTQSDILSESDSTCDSDCFDNASSSSWDD